MGGGLVMDVVMRWWWKWLAVFVGRNTINERTSDDRCHVIAHSSNASLHINCDEGNVHPNHGVLDSTGDEDKSLQPPIRLT